MRFQKTHTTREGMTDRMALCFEVGERIIALTGPSLVFATAKQKDVWTLLYYQLVDALNESDGFELVDDLNGGEICHSEKK
jgi:hypothetical protein